jgi:hypothetical protein
MHDELEPVASDLDEARQQASRPTTWGRGGTVFLASGRFSVRKSRHCDLRMVMLAATILWLVSCPPPWRLLATAVLSVWVVAIRPE